MDKKANYTSFSDFCSQHIFEQKRIIMPNRKSGYQYFLSNTQNCDSMLNINAITLKDLAMEVLSGIVLQEGYILAEPLTCIFLILDILNRYKSDLPFFTRITPDIHMAGAIYKNLTDLSLACVDLAGYFNGKTVHQNNSQKIKDLIFIVDKFRNVLDREKLLDYPALLSAALEMLSDKSGVQAGKLYRYAIPQNCEMKELERRFFEKLTDGCYTVIAMPQPEGYNRPKDYIIAECGKPVHEPVKVERIKVIGKANELIEVLRDIKRKNIPLDQVLILYTGKEYVQIAYDLFTRYKISATFDAGIPIINSKAYSFLVNLLDWINSDYEVKYLLDMLRSGSIYFKEAEEAEVGISNIRIATILEKKNIGWSRERYELLMGNDDPVENEETDSVKRDKKACELIYNFVKEATEKIDNKGGKANIKTISQGLTELVDKYVMVKGDKDASGKACIINTLNILSNIPDCETDFNKAVQYIKTLMEDLSFGQSNPQAGHIHVAPIEQGVWNDRPYLYAVGITDEQLKGDITEDPILDDYERQIFSDKLPESTDSYSRSVYKLMEALLNDRKSIVFTCSAFDTVAIREENTTLSLAGINLIEKKTEAFNKDMALNLDEIRAMSKPTGTAGHKESENIAETVEQEKTGPGDEPSEDVEESTVHLERTFSSTSLENYARCPRLYLYKHILKLSEEKYVVEKEKKWLNSMEEGKLYHAVLCDIYKNCSSNDLLSDKDKLIGTVTKVVEKYAGETRTQIPCPSEEIFRSWKNEAVEYLTTYIRKDLERLNEERLTPCAFELSFKEEGSEGNLEGAIINTSPVEVEFGKFKIRLNGIIDRIDKDIDGNFEIVDYKSGKSERFYKGKGKELDEGKHFQHYLYSIALEKILERAGMPAKVIRARYEFIKEYKQAGPIEQSEDYRKEMSGIIELLLNDLKNDNRFIRCIDKEDLSEKEIKDTRDYCIKFCSYNAICEVKADEEVEDA